MLPGPGRLWYHLDMETIIRNVRDINTGERQVLEHVLGRHLGENQQVIIQVVTLPGEATPPPLLPAWCNVFAGLTEEDVAGVEAVMRQRTNLTRSNE